MSEMKAQQFRKKPVVIEAVRFTGKNVREVMTFIMGHPPTLDSDYAKEKWDDFCTMSERDGIHIATLEDGPKSQVSHWAMPGDWIIKGIQDEFYPCKPDIFEETYDPVDFDARIRSAIEPAKVTVQEEFESVRRYLAAERKPEPVESKLLFTFSQCLRHAFLTGAGYGEFEKISDEDQQRWVAYDPSAHKSFKRIEQALYTPQAAPAIAPVNVYKVLKRAFDNGMLDDDHLSSLSREISSLSPAPSPVGESRSALIERLVGALGPFARVAELDIGADEADADMFEPMRKYNLAPKLTVGNFREARSAVDAAKQENA